MARNKKSNFGFEITDGLDFAMVNEKANDVPSPKNDSDEENLSNIEKTEIKEQALPPKTEDLENPEHQDKNFETKYNVTKLRFKRATYYNIDPTIPIKQQNIQYKQDNCKPRVATILDEYMRFIRVRSKKLGIPLNLYINIIIDEYRSEIENIEDETRYAELYNELSRQYKGSKLRTNFFLIPENSEFIEEEITNIGCQPSQYFNHIIALEIQKEKINGIRI